MATKTFIFAGYSLRDSDFQLILDEINSSLDRFRKLAYARDPNASDETIEYWKPRGIQVHKIHGIRFPRLLREKFVGEDILPPDDFIRFFEEERRRIFSAHFERDQDESILKVLRWNSATKPTR